MDILHHASVILVGSKGFVRGFLGFGVVEFTESFELIPPGFGCLLIQIKSFIGFGIIQPIPMINNVWWNDMIWESHFYQYTFQKIASKYGFDRNYHCV